MKCKICGMRSLENLNAILALRPSYLGIIVHESSPRSVSLAQAKEILLKVRNHEEIPLVLVLRDESEESVQRILSELPVQILQLHGQESPQLIQGIRRSYPTLQVWKAISVGSDFSTASLLPYAKDVDAFLFDTTGDSGGGTGKSFDWEKLTEYSLELPFLLAGGIGPDSLAPLQDFFHNHPRLREKLLALDLNSRFERSPGEKDEVLLEKFLMALEQSDV